jgi:hypothetical protein
MKIACRVCAFVLLFSALPVQAQDQGWAEKLFDKLNHDFGVVARGADARYRLAITNRYVQTVHIANVRTSCGCTAAKPSQDTLLSRESAYIELTMDTRKFTHQKDSTVTVVFDAPLYAEVRIPVRAFIRTDVVLTPGSAEFGSIPKGAEQTRKISVAYAGRDDWQIREVVSKNPNIAVKLDETARGEGRVSYELTVSIKGSAPIGDLRDQLTLLTDDAGNPQIPVLIEARVEPEFVVSPNTLSFGVLNPGEKRTVNIVIRGKKPFAIEKIESEKTSVFEARLPQDSRVIHVLPITLTAPSEAGAIDETFTVTIPGSTDIVQFRAYGKIAGTGPAPAPEVAPTTQATP